MSSNFTVQRRCEHCNKRFNAKTTVTRFCSKLCNKRQLKAKERNEKIGAEKQQSIILSAQVVESVQSNEFLDTRKAALLLGVSRNLIYHLINTGKLNAYNLSIRRTIILKRDIDSLFETRCLQVRPKEESRKMPKIEDCYYMGELQEKFKISEGALYHLIKRNNIAKFKVGKFTYVSKKSIEAIFLNQN